MLQFFCADYEFGYQICQKIIHSSRKTMHLNLKASTGSLLASNIPVFDDNKYQIKVKAQF